MGLLFTRKTKKEKVIDKIYNSFYVKENIIENFRINERDFDCIVISSYGLFIFRILTSKYEIKKNGDNFFTLNEKDEEVYLGNPFLELEKDKEIISKLINKEDLPFYLEVIIGKNKNFKVNEEFGIGQFRQKLDKCRKCVENYVVDDVFKFIKNVSCHIIIK